MFLKIFTILLLKDSLFLSAASLSHLNSNHTEKEKVFYVYPVTSSPISVVYPEINVPDHNILPENNSFSTTEDNHKNFITMSDNLKIINNATTHILNNTIVNLLIQNENVQPDTSFENISTINESNSNKIFVDKLNVNITEDYMNVNLPEKNDFQMKINEFMSEQFVKYLQENEMKTEQNTKKSQKNESNPITMQIITINGMEDYIPSNHSHIKTDPKAINNQEKIDLYIAEKQKYDEKPSTNTGNLTNPFINAFDQILQPDSKTKNHLNIIPFTINDIMMNSKSQKPQQNLTSPSVANTTFQKIDEIELDTDASDIVYDIEEIDKLLPSNEKGVFIKSTDIHPDNPYFKHNDDNERESSEKISDTQLKEDIKIEPVREVIELPPGSFASMWSGLVTEVKQDKPGDYNFHRHNNLHIIGPIPKPLITYDSFKNQLSLPTAGNPSPFL